MVALIRNLDKMSDRLRRIERQQPHKEGGD
jgi:hypothetical protein